MNPTRRPKGFLGSNEGLKKLQAKKREKRYTYENIRKEANVTLDQVKRLFNPQWGYKIGTEAIELIAAVLDLQPEDIVGFDAWNSSANVSEVETTEINWRQICNAMLESQQAAARLRRQATERGFELNVYVPLGLVERKQQQRRQQDEQREREKVYELTEEVIVKTYEHDAFLNQVIGQQPTGNNKHIAIIGEPGAGKTTLLSTIATYIKDQTQNLFIYISLANLQGRTIEEYLLQRWLPEALRFVKSDFIVTPAEIERQLIECFGKLRIWLLLDGVDEMGENSPTQALAKINQQLTESLRQARVVLTCRLNVWDAQVKNTLSGFDTYKTQEFQPEQIYDFIQQWFTCAKNCQKGETLQAKLKADRHDNIRKLVTNPLRLALLCQTFDLDSQGELPETKAALYQRFTRYFYDWKSELFPDLSDSDDLKDELHSALSKLAFAGINSSSRFRLRRRLARQEIGEELFKLACDVGWLNLVDRLAQSDEEVYAFYHPNFQEYFAALAVKDWHEFLNHIPDNPKQGTYRIFAPQWKEVILLWLGREDVRNEEKEAFIRELVEFNDGCGEWNREDIDKGFYDYRAYFLAAAGIAEFKHCSRTDEIVEQIVKWRFGYFNTNQHKWVKFLGVIVNEAETALQQTERTKAIATLVQLLQSQDVDDDTRRLPAYGLGKIDPGNENAIAALEQLLQSQDVDDYTRWLAAYSLEKIGTGNEKAIAALEQLLQSQDVDDYTRRQVAESLGKIDPGNENAITALEQLLQSQDVDYRTRRLAAESLGKIDPGNKNAIAALVQLLQSQDVDNFTRRQAAVILEKIGTGNENAIAALVQLLQSQDVDDDTRRQAAKSLGEIGTGNENAITALVQLLQSQDVDDDTRSDAAYSLGEIDPGNENAIATLVQLLQSPYLDNFTRWQAAVSLGKILQSNEQRFLAVKALKDYLQFNANYNVIWKCAQNMPYPDFYNAWHDG
jgi:predicted NACHT family NTPase